MNAQKLVLLLISMTFLATKTAYPENGPIGKQSTEAAFKQEPASPLDSPGKLASAVRSAETAKENQLMESLVSTNRRVGLSAAIELRGQMQQLESELMAILTSTNSISRKFPAIVVLGEHRAPQAAPILVQHLEWDDEARPIIGVTSATFEKSALECCPVRIALEEIGEPAIAPLLDRIVKTDDIKIIEKSAFICHEIEGRDVTQFRLQALLSKETDPKKKARIQSALEALEKNEHEQQEIKQRVEQLRKNIK
jgi:hypothetical protein